jgi:hypothetical protein
VDLNTDIALVLLKWFMTLSPKLLQEQSTEVHCWRDKCSQRSSRMNMMVYVVQATGAQYPISTERESVVLLCVYARFKAKLNLCRVEVKHV